jgi:hypothetical protein
MDLSEFVRETLNSIVTGVVNSQDDMKDTNAIINPSTINADGFIGHKGKRKVTNISFNVAVTVEDIDEGRKGFKIAVADIISLGTNNQEKTANQVISRIAFEIPLLLPINDRLTEEANAENNRDLYALASMV